MHTQFLARKIVAHGKLPSYLVFFFKVNSATIHPIYAVTCMTVVKVGLVLCLIAQRWQISAHFFFFRERKRVRIW